MSITSEHLFYHQKTFATSLLKKILFLFLLCIWNNGLSNSQPASEVRVSLNLVQVPLSEVLRDIELKTGYSFFYRNEDLSLSRKITIQVDNAPLVDILTALFNDNAIAYEIMDRQVILQKMEDPNGLTDIFHDTDSSFEIQGKVTNEYTGEAIPFCNIAIASSFIGTATNELGEFSLQVDSLPVTLIFSHIRFEKYTAEVSSPEELTILLTPLTNTLDEVTVIALKNDNYAMELAKKAFEKAKQANKKQNYGKALYRQKSKNSEEYAEFSEIIYDIRYTSEGIVDWDILEGRYALKEKAVYNKNYTLLSRLLKPLQPNTEDIIFPFHPNMMEFYNISMLGRIDSGNDKIAILWFKPKDHVYKPIFEGEVFVNVRNHQLLKVNGKLADDDLKLAQLKEKDSYWKNYTIKYEIAYKQNDELGLVMDYINVSQNFDYYKKNRPAFPVSTTSTLTFFEHYVPTSRKKLGGRMRRNVSDWKRLDAIGYDAAFWKENAIIKRTQEEEDIIASFTKDNAFGSIFLDRKEQIATLQNDISNDAFIQKLEDALTLYYKSNPTEKVYLHVDRETYSAGDDLWFSGYVVLGPNNMYSQVSKVLYVSLIGPDNTVIHSQQHTVQEGKCSGYLHIPKSLNQGNYQVRAYTQWMLNFDDDAFFYTKTLKVLNPTIPQVTSVSKIGDMDVQFFPEGGHLVAGLTQKVAFKVLGADGLERNFKGKVVDDNGKIVASLNTMFQDMGFFTITPDHQKSYTAVLKDGTTFAIPKILDNGYAITVDNSGVKSIKVRVQASDSLRKNPFYIIGHSPQRKLFQGKFIFGDTPLVTFEIPKTKLQSGIFTITLLDEDQKPWSERVAFVNNRDELIIDAKLNENRLEKRGKIIVDVKVSDVYGNPVSTSLSIAITDAGQAPKDKNENNILTHLLLQSDIKVPLKNPMALIAKEDRASMLKKDLLMLTHDWRSFDWQEAWAMKLEGNVISEAEFPEISPEHTMVDYDFSKTFYSPKYEAGTKPNDSIDHRTALYWNPALMTDSKGKASFEFYNSDKAQTFDISIETLSERGIPGTYLKTFGKR
ncbi:MAG: carboxypeptidase-like regulatory domain-containing protein [Bacteroidota bacterium]